ncbi:MAG: Rieske (2Fe-2S) protein [Candidatus Nanopelagicales bacterium]
MTAWTPTYTVDQVAAAPLRFDHGAIPVLVAMVDDVPRAVSDACLHRGASLADGLCRDGVITCPSHWWRYDLRDGALEGSPGVHLASYPCRIVDGTIEVDLPPAPVTRSLREILLDHARGHEEPDA